MWKPTVRRDRAVALTPALSAWFFGDSVVLSTASLFPAYDITPELDDHNNQVLDAAGDPKLTKILILDDDGNTTYGPLVNPCFLSSPGAIIFSRRFFNKRGI